MPTAETQLASFLAKYTPEIAAKAAAILAKMRELLPHATEVVYDNYNALAIGFGPGEKTSHVIFSIAIYPRWVSLFFLQAKGLSDPDKLLKGGGTVARHIVIEDASKLDDPGVRALMDQALATAVVQLDATAPRRLIIKSISAKQRPRRPTEAKAGAPRKQKRSAP